MARERRGGGERERERDRDSEQYIYMLASHLSAPLRMCLKRSIWLNTIKASI